MTPIKSKIILPLIMVFLSLCYTQRTSAQALELIGANTLNGAINGAILGASSIKLVGSNDLTPLRIGVGAGIIGGLAVAIHDISVLPRGQEFYISGTFNDGTNSSVIILLDTVYGAVGGAVIGSAVMLLRDDPIVDGLQYGAGAGAWVGFGFGLLDAFSFGNKNEDFISDAGQSDTSGSLVNLRGLNYTVGLFGSGIFESREVRGSKIVSRFNPVMEMISLRMKL